MTKKDEYEIERDRQELLRKKAMNSLTKEQIDAINFTHETLRDALSMLTECHDLYLSDINKLNDAFWKLKHQFNLGNNND